MEFFKMFKTPYLDGDDGANLGGGAQQQQQTAGTAPDTTGQQQQQQTDPMFKLKYNHEEKEIPYSQAVELAQKGMNYDKVQEKLQSLENNPGLSWIQQQAQRYGMTVENFIDAMNRQEEQDQLNELIQKNIPPEYAEKLMKVDKLEQWKQSFEQTENRRKDYEALLGAYPELIDPQKAATIPKAVWDKVNQGKSLLDAYNEYQVAEYRKQIATMTTNQQAGQTVNDKNLQNAQSSAGSAKSDGPVPGDFISKETFEQNKHNMKWVQDNLDKLNKSQKKWFK